MPKDCECSRTFTVSFNTSSDFDRVSPVAAVAVTAHSKAEAIDAAVEDHNVPRDGIVEVLE